MCVRICYLWFFFKTCQHFAIALEELCSLIFKQRSNDEFRVSLNIREKSSLFDCLIVSADYVLRENKYDHTRTHR